MNPQSKPETKFVTTAIVYPNARVHVGWGWECLGADWLVRASKAFGESVYFLTGMDEHALKVQRAAEAKGLSPQAYCDQMATDVTKVLGQAGIGYDRFIRTSDPDHLKVVSDLIKRSFERGDIYQGSYEGYYCDGCEAYYIEKDLVGGLCPAHKTPPKWINEQNYFFKLSKYQDALLKLYETNPDFITPEHRRSEIVNFVKAGLKDFSVSRSTFSWGVPLPWQPEHVVYVWFDALINYLTGAGIAEGEATFKKRWPAAVHIIGKDISRFHTVYWPAMLMSLGIELPKKVFIHGHLNLKGERMSKSSGNVITPDEVIAYSGVDAFRYCLLAENPFHGDGTFSFEGLTLKVNADLANDLGNLVNRSINMSRKYFPEGGLKRPAAETHSASVREVFEKLLPELRECVDQIDPQGYIQACMARSRALNLYIDQTKPWALAKKGEETKTELAEVLYTLCEGVRWIATVMAPVLLNGSPEIFRQLGVQAPPADGSFAKLKWGDHSYSPLEPKPVFPRLELGLEKAKE